MNMRPVLLFLFLLGCHVRFGSDEIGGRVCSLRPPDSNEEKEREIEGGYDDGEH
jgi:hypothetical protein